MEGINSSVDIMQLAIIVTPDCSGTVDSQHLLIGIEPAIRFAGQSNVRSKNIRPKVDTAFTERIVVRTAHSI